MAATTSRSSRKELSLERPLTWPRRTGFERAIRVYDPASKTFGAYNPNGTTRTSYKPDPGRHGYLKNLAYWLAQ